MDDSKTSAPGSAEPQLRNGCLGFWSVKAELGLRGPGGGTAGDRHFSKLPRGQTLLDSLLDSQHLGARSPSSAMAVWVFGASKRSWGSAVPGRGEGTDTFFSGRGFEFWKQGGLSVEA